MRFTEILSPNGVRGLTARRLDEMNVLNAADFDRDLRARIAAALSGRQAELPPPVADLLAKRLNRAAANDEHGAMVRATPVPADRLPPAAPAWATAAAARGEALVLIEPGEDFDAKLAHVVDWLVADPNPMEAIRTQPEQGLLDNLYAQADRFFAERNARLTTDEEEDGREVVMTFRKAPRDAAFRSFAESRLEPDDERGPVVAFWCKLTSEAALNREGKLMQHCVGGYANLVRHQGATIYSLRDAANKPHVTVEAQRNGDQQVINQIKGKQNQPPLGKYMPFVKIFMNELGLSASSTGERDAKAVGLVARAGRYGEFHEVARMLHDFPSGARIMTLHEGLAPADEKGWGGIVRPTAVETAYVLPDRSTALVLNFLFRPNSELAFEGAKLLGVEILRNAPRLFPLWADDLIPFLNGAGVLGDSARLAALERVGVFLHDGAWGRLPEVAERLVESDGLVAFGLLQRVIVVEAATLAPVATLEQSGPLLIKTEAANPAAGESLSRLLLAYARADEAGQMDSHRYRAKLSHTSRTRELLRRYGLLHVGAKQGWQHVSDVARARQKDPPVYKSPHGSIRLYQQRWFFLGPDGNFLGVAPNPAFSHSAELGGAGPALEANDTLWNTNEQGDKLLRLLASLQVGVRYPIILKGFAESERVVKAGWTVRRGRLVHKSEVEGRIRLSGNAQATVEVSPNGGSVLAIQEGGVEWVSVYGDPDGVLSASRKITDDVSRRPALFAEALNATGLGVRRSDMLNLHLGHRDGRFFGLDAEADADILAYAAGYRAGYVSPQGWKFRMAGAHGYIEMGNGDQIAARVDITSDDLTVSMPKGGPGGVSRRDVVRAVAEALHWWHERIEPVYHDGPQVYRAVGSA